MQTYSYSVRGQVDLEDQADAIENYTAVGDLPPWGPLCTFRERQGHIADHARGARRLPLARRGEGGRLFNLLQLGDHVVFSSIQAAFRSFADWQEAVSRFNEHGVTSHFAAESLSIPPGDPLVADAALFRWLHAELIAHRGQVRRAADAMGIPVARRRRSNHCPIEQFEEITRRDGGGGGRLFPYVRTSPPPGVLGEPDFAEQEKCVRRLANSLAEADSRLSVQTTRLDDSLRTAGFRFMDCPRGSEILREVGQGDALIVPSIQVAFRSMEDFAATDWFLRARGAALIVAAEDLHTATRAGRRLVNSFAWLGRLRSRWHLPTLRGDLAPPLPACVREVQVTGKTVLQIDDALLRIVRSVQRIAAKGCPARKIARRLEELDAARFDDGVLIPPEGVDAGSAVGKSIHPEHGVHGPKRIHRRWRRKECERMRTRTYWRELEQLASDQGFRRAPRVRWPRPVP